MAALEGGVLAQLNGIRTAHGLRPLTVNPQLSAAALRHTADMLADGTFEHESPGGTSFSERIRSFYGQAGKNRWAVGENLLWSAPVVGPKRALQVWMASPGHRENILSPTWREIGIAAEHADTSLGVFGGGAVTVITTDFGARG
jgi:uncharacterized protein YkwD